MLKRLLLGSLISAGVATATCAGPALAGGNQAQLNQMAMQMYMQQQAANEAQRQAAIAALPAQKAAAEAAFAAQNGLTGLPQPQFFSSHDAYLDALDQYNYNLHYNNMVNQRQNNRFNYWF